MILFIVSFLLVFSSSYFFVSVMKPQNDSVGLIYLYLTIFAQIVLTFELLSSLGLINQMGVLVINTLVFVISIYLWNRQSRVLWKPSISDFKNRFSNSIKKDFSLKLLFIGFCVFICVSFFLCLIAPIMNDDSLSYHIARCLFWISQGSLNHFEIADIRNLCLPINSEILYSWVLLFTKKNVFLGFFNFTGYLLCVVSLYEILGNIGYSLRKKLWVIFIISSLPLVVLEVSSSETDLIIAGLVLSSILLFWNAHRVKSKLSLFMSALAYALALGTKTTAFVMIPAVGLMFLIICYYFKNFSMFWKFLLLGCINFLIFSSYNYFLNYFDFSAFMGPSSYIAVNKNYYGISGAFANFIKHLFMFIDFSGFKWAIYLDKYVKAFEHQILNLFMLEDIPEFYATTTRVRTLLIETVTGAGILGFLVYLPCSIRAVLFCKKPSKKQVFLFVFGVVFFINLFVLSSVINYSSYDIRYIVSFLVLSTPVLVYSYRCKFKFFKNLVVFFALFSFVFVSTNLALRPFFPMLNYLLKTRSVTQVREKLMLRDPVYMLNYRIRKAFKPNASILVFLSKGQNIYSIKSLSLDGYNVIFAELSDFDKLNLSKYNILIVEGFKQVSYLKTDSFARISFNRVASTNAVSCFYSKPLPHIDKPCFKTCFLDNRFLYKNGFAQHFNLDVGGDEEAHYYIFTNSKNPPQSAN